jgi:hypothetical protein
MIDALRISKACIETTPHSTQGCATTSFWPTVLLTGRKQKYVYYTALAAMAQPHTNNILWNKRFYAENHYAHWCLFNPDGTYEGVEEDRTSLRNELDELAEYLSSFRSDNWKETQRFWTALEAAEAEEEYAAELAGAEEEEQAEAREEEGVDAAEAREEEAVAAAEVKTEQLAIIAEGQEEQDAKNAEAETEEGADLSPHTIEALNKQFDAEYDAAAQLRNKPEDTAPAETSTKVRRSRTRIPGPTTAASTKSPRRSKVPDRFGYGPGK